jgi:hypothetical protein
MRTPSVTRGRTGHEVSKPSLTDARWRAERIGPMIIVAPHRGQLQSARVSVVDVSVGVATGAPDPELHR